MIKDPLTGNFFRLREAERFISELLDGETPLSLVRERAALRFSAELSDDALRAFVSALGEAGLLEGGTRRPAKKPKRLSGSILYLQWALLDPDVILGDLVQRLGFLFTRVFVIIAAAAIISALAVTSIHWHALRQGVRHMAHLGTLPSLIIATFAIASLHELAHGATCKYFGGQVREMGLLLIYFQPAFYCDVTDAWSFADKKQRLWVGFAGPFFELFIWALAIMAWNFSQPHTAVNRLALVVATMSGVKTLVNLSPFIKLDGYYLLSDFLELPNLRAASFRYVGNLLRRCVRRALPSPADDAPARVRHIYLAYGLFGVGLSLVLLAFVAANAWREWVDDRRLTTLIVAAVGVGLSLRRRIRKLFKSPKTLGQTEEAEP